MHPASLPGWPSAPVWFCESELEVPSVLLQSPVTPPAWYLFVTSYFLIFIFHQLHILWERTRSLLLQNLVLKCLMLSSLLGFSWRVCCWGFTLVWFLKYFYLYVCVCMCFCLSVFVIIQLWGCQQRPEEEWRSYRQLSPSLHPGHRFWDEDSGLPLEPETLLRNVWGISPGLGLSFRF